MDIFDTVKEIIENEKELEFLLTEKELVSLIKEIFYQENKIIACQKKEEKNKCGNCSCGYLQSMYYRLNEAIEISFEKTLKAINIIKDKLDKKEGIC